LYGLPRHAERQVNFHVSIEFQACQRFELRNDPATFLAAADPVRESDLLSGFGEHSKGMDGVLGIAAWLKASNSDDKSNIGKGGPPRRANAESTVARENFSVADVDARAAEGHLEKSKNYK
jgi:hypothetical protein